MGEFFRRVEGTLAVALRFGCRAMAEQNPVSQDEEIRSPEHLEEKIDQLKRYLSQDNTMSEEEREAELKKARIALMRKLRSPTTPFNSVEDFSKQASGQGSQKVGRRF